jgi:hypothetical protein
LAYALNGGPLLPLNIGPNYRRLAARGDFNVDLGIEQLVEGENRLTLVATDEQGQQTTEQVLLRYSPTHRSLPYRIEWGKVANIQDVAQVVDGLWSINNGQISPEEIGYDRLVAVGDMSWRDYEVTVPITVHGINAACYEYPSVHAGVGVVIRWKGHTLWEADQYSSDQPAFGPSPYGAIGWYCVFHDAGNLINFFDPAFNRMVEQPRRLVLHQPYIFKVRVDTRADGGSQYRLRVWEADSREPDTWDITASGTDMSLSEGSLVLGAHHVAVSFGNIDIRA